jgi:hypothetical protein
VAAIAYSRPLVRRKRGAVRREQAQDVGDVVGEAVDVGGRARDAQQLRDDGVAAGRTADAEVDAPRRQRLQRRELLGDDERRVVRQHDAARADADALGARRRRAMSTGGVVDATAGMLWCSANQYRVKPRRSASWASRTDAATAPRTGLAAPDGDEVEHGEGGARKSSLRATDAAAPLFRKILQRPAPFSAEGHDRSGGRHPLEPPGASLRGGVARAPAFIGWGRAAPLSRDPGEERMTVHYELPTTADFAALAGPHNPAITIYASTSPVVAERERAEVAVKSAFDEAIEQIKASGASNRELTELRQEREAILSDEPLWAGLARSLAVFVSPGFSEVFVLPNRLDDASHVGSHFTLGPAAAGARARTRRRTRCSSRPTSGRCGTRPPRPRAQMPVDPTLPKNADDAANREAGEAGTRRVGGHGDRGSSEEDRVPTSSTSTRSGWPTRCARCSRCTTPTSAYRCSSSPRSRR